MSLAANPILSDLNDWQVFINTIETNRSEHKTLLNLFLQILVKADEVVTSDDEDYDVTGGSGDDEAWHSEVRQVKNLKYISGL